MPHEFDGQTVTGNHCNRCDKVVEWFHIPDSLASACKDCGFVRVGFGNKNEAGEHLYDAGATLQEWSKALYDRSEQKKE